MMTHSELTAMQTRAKNTSPQTASERTALDTTILLCEIVESLHALTAALEAKAGAHA